MSDHFYIYFLDTNLRIRQGKVYLIGRSVRSDIALPDGSVSRKHASIEWMGDRFLLRDLQSTNGTYVNNKRITVHTLQADDTIRIGNFELRHVIEEGEDGDGLDSTMPLMQTMQMGEAFGESAGDLEPTLKASKPKTVRTGDLPGKDALTGCFNRAYFERVIGDEVRISDEFDQHMALLMIDVDGFGKVNEEHGSETSDDVLCVVAGVVNNVARPNDIVARYSSDQFVVIAPNAGPAVSQELGESIRTKVLEHTQKTGVKVSVSVGVSGFGKINDTAPKLVKSAEDALARAKEKGRDRVEMDD